jgi:hypothetical protein
MRLFLLLALVSVNAFASPASSFVSSGDAEYLNRMHSAAAKAKLGTKLRQHGVAVAVYDYSKDGGAVGTLSLPVKLPLGAIITDVKFDVASTVSSLGSATIAFGANTTTDLKGATAFASWTGIVAGVPVGSAATAVKLTNDRAVTMTIATAALTSGKINALVEYVYPKQ